jgi:hypothetical protein
MSRSTLMQKIRSLAREAAGVLALAAVGVVFFGMAQAPAEEAPPASPPAASNPQATGS